MTPGALALLAVVAFLAGAVDAIAGGGGMLTVPAILTAGLPTHLALGTNKGVSTWGTAAATFTFARAGKLAWGPGLLGFGGGGLGAALGAQLQLAFSPRMLRPIVLVLLVIVAVTLAIPRKKVERETRVAPQGSRPTLVAFGIALVIGAYDGFFGPGTGTFLIVAYASLLGATLAEATASAKTVNLGSNVVSLATFALRGTVLWKVALPMAAANIVGGIVGARLAIKGGDRLVRALVIAVSLSLVGKLAFDLLRG